MKKIILIFLLFITAPVFAKIADSKDFPLSSDNAYLLVLDTLSRLNFKITELQSDSGYILFQSNEGNEYLIMVSKKDENSSNIKVQKLRIYAPSREIIQKIFEGISNNLNNLPKRAD